MSSGTREKSGSGTREKSGSTREKFGTEGKIRSQVAERAGAGWSGPGGRGPGGRGRAGWGLAGRVGVGRRHGPEVPKFVFMAVGFETYGHAQSIPQFITSSVGSPPT